MDLLAAEMTAKTGINPREHYRKLTEEFGTSFYTRVDKPATLEQKAVLQNMSPRLSRRERACGRKDIAKNDESSQ